MQGEHGSPGENGVAGVMVSPLVFFSFLLDRGIYYTSFIKKLKDFVFCFLFSRALVVCLVREAVLDLLDLL